MSVVSIHYYIKVIRVAFMGDEADASKMGIPVFL